MSRGERVEGGEWSGANGGEGEWRCRQVVVWARGGPVKQKWGGEVWARGGQGVGEG